MEDLFEIDLGNGKNKKKPKIEQPKQEENLELVTYRVDYYLNYMTPLYFENRYIEFEIVKGQTPTAQKLVEEIKRKYHRDVRISFINLERSQKIEIDEQQRNESHYGLL